MSTPRHPPPTDWTARIKDHFSTDSWRELQSFLGRERGDGEVFPAPADVFRAFHLTSFEQTRIVILGQDPYHGPGQAHGLSFSVPAGVKPPPSLRNIFKELESDVGVRRENGDLTGWAKQGVLLLNTVLTVRAGEAGSHQRRGWETFTDRVIQAVDQHPQRVVFLLWGKPAQTKEPLIGDRHAVLKSPHPSPLSAHRGFFGSRPFSTANHLLSGFSRDVVDWTA